MIGKENESAYNLERTKLAVKIRIWGVNKFDKLQVNAQAENTKKSTSWSLGKVKK